MFYMFCYELSTNRNVEQTYEVLDVLRIPPEAPNISGYYRYFCFVFVSSGVRLATAKVRYALYGVRDSTPPLSTETNPDNRPANHIISAQINNARSGLLPA